MKNNQFEIQFPSLKGKAIDWIDNGKTEFAWGYKEIQENCLDKEKVRAIIDDHIDFLVKEGMESNETTLEVLKEELGL